MALVGPVGPGPVGQHQQAAAETDEKKDVGGQPEPPGHQARETQAAQVDDRRAAADRRQVAVVAVGESRAAAAGQPRLDRCGHMRAHLLGRRRGAGDRQAVGLRQRDQVARHENLGLAAQAEVGRDANAAGAVELVGRGREQAAERRSGHARGPQHRARGSELFTAQIAVGVDGLHRLARQHLDPEAAQVIGRTLGQAGRKASQHTRSGLDQLHLGARGVDMAEFAGQGVARDLRQRARELDARRPATDDGKGQPGVALGRALGDLGALEGQQDATPQQQRIVERLQARRVRSPLVVAEVVVRGATGHEQEVIGQRRAVGTQHAARGQVDRGDLGHADRHVALVAQDVAQRRGDVTGREPGRGHLVEQRLEQVVVGAVDQGDVDRRLGQRPRRPQASKAATDDDDVRAAGLRCSVHQPYGNASLSSPAARCATPGSSPRPTNAASRSCWRGVRHSRH